MKSSVLARRFAKALIDLGREDNSYGRYGAELRAVAEVFKATPELYRVLLNPMYPLAGRVSLAEKVSEGVKASAPVAKFINVLVETRSVKLLDDITAAYSRLEDELSGTLRATVESPVELDAAALEEIRKKLESLTGATVAVAFRVNAGLIGGILVRLDNTVLDGSLRTQLDLMKEKILEGVG